MNHNIRKTLTATLLIAAVLLTAAAAGAAYEPAAIDPPLSPHLLSIQADPAQQANQLAWTPYRRLTAQPPATDEISPEMMANALAIRQVLEPAAEPGFVPGSLPQPGAEAQAQVDFSQEWTSSQAGENAAAGASHAGDVSATPSNLFGAEAYSSFYANQFAAMWKHYPYRAIGKLYFDTPNGPAYCTASVIGPDLIVTAARCIMDTTSDTIYNNFAFCPAARGSVCPFGSYPWAGILLHFAYLEAASWTEVIDVDVALIHLEVNQAGVAFKLIPAGSASPGTCRPASIPSPLVTWRRDKAASSATPAPDRPTSRSRMSWRWAATAGLVIPAGRGW